MDEPRREGPIPDEERRSKAKSRRSLRERRFVNRRRRETAPGSLLRASRRGRSRVSAGSPRLATLATLSSEPEIACSRSRGPPCIGARASHRLPELASPSGTRNDLRHAEIGPETSALEPETGGSPRRQPRASSGRSANLQSSSRLSSPFPELAWSRFSSFGGS
jgi:hypothetical protein